MRPDFKEVIRDLNELLRGESGLTKRLRVSLCGTIIGRIRRIRPSQQPMVDYLMAFLSFLFHIILVPQIEVKKASRRDSFSAALLSSGSAPPEQPHQEGGKRELGSRAEMAAGGGGWAGILVSPADGTYSSFRPLKSQQRAAQKAPSASFFQPRGDSGGNDSQKPTMPAFPTGKGRLSAESVPEESSSELDPAIMVAPADGTRVSFAPLGKATLARRSSPAGMGGGRQGPGGGKLSTELESPSDEAARGPRRGTGGEAPSDGVDGVATNEVQALTPESGILVAPADGTFLSFQPLDRGTRGDN